MLASPVGFVWALSRPLRLAVMLAAVSVLIAVGYLLFPGRSALFVIPVFFAVHGFVSLWATAHAFSASKDLRGCGPGVALWLWLSLEVMVLGPIWGSFLEGPH